MNSSIIFPFLCFSLFFALLIYGCISIYHTTHQTTLLTQAPTARRCIGGNFAEKSSLCGSRTRSTLHRRNKVSNHFQCRRAPFCLLFFIFFIFASFFSISLSIHKIYKLYDFESLFFTRYIGKSRNSDGYILCHIVFEREEKRNKNLFTATNI